MYGLTEIFAKINEEYIDGVKVSYKYHVDENNVWWIRFDDVIDFLHFNERKAEMLYRKEISEENKFSFLDKNEYDNYGDRTDRLVRFITMDALRDIMYRNNKRNNAFIKSVNNLEYGTEEKTYDVEEYLDEMMKTLSECIDLRNIDALIYNSGNLYNSKLGRERMDRIGVINKNIEDELDNVRDCMYKEEAYELLLLDKDQTTIIELNNNNGIWEHWFNKED